MSRSSSARQRGTTLVELLIVTGVLGLFLTLGVTLVTPVLNAANKLQAKADTLQSAVTGLYRMRRDVRMSGIGGDYACTASAPVTCSQPSLLTATPAVAILTAQSGGQPQYMTTTGNANIGLPTWQGVDVYWVASNASGTFLYEAFGAFPSGIQELPASNPVTQAQVQTAVALALAGTSTVVAPNVSQLSASFKPSQHVMGLKIFSSGNEGGRLNETSFESDTYARN